MATFRDRSPATRTSTTLFHQLDVAGISWLDWEESAANPCDMFDHGAIWAKNGYVSHRNPTLYLDDIQAHHASEDVVPSAECRAKASGPARPRRTT